MLVYQRVSNVQDRIDVIPLNPGCLRMELSPFFSISKRLFCSAQLNGVNERNSQNGGYSLHMGVS